jgi:hypothetical protein
LFVLSLVLPFPFPFYFYLVQYSCSFCIAVLYLYLFPHLFTYFLLLCLPLLFNSLLIFNFPVPFMVFNSYFTLPPSMSTIFALQYIRPWLLISSLAYFLFLNAFPFRPLHSSAINSILAWMFWAKHGGRSFMAQCALLTEDSSKTFQPPKPLIYPSHHKKLCNESGS